MLIGGVAAFVGYDGVLDFVVKTRGKRKRKE